MKPIIIKFFILTIITNSYSQEIVEYRLPIIEDSIRFCTFCENEFVVDKFWLEDNYTYTKLKSEKFVHILFQKTDSTFQLRTYHNNEIISKGDIILKMSNEISQKGTTSYDCPSFYEKVEIFKFIKPQKIGNWEFSNSEGIKCNGEYDENENKIGVWKYIHNDTITVKDHESGKTYFLNPNLETLNSNLNWLLKNHKVNFKQNKNLTVASIFKHLNFKDYKIEFKQNFNPNSSFVTFEFKEEGILKLNYQENEKIILSEDLKWSLDKKGKLNILEEGKIQASYEIHKYGKEEIVLLTRSSNK